MRALLPVLFLAVAVGCATPPPPRSPVNTEGERLLSLGVRAFGNDAYAQAADLFHRALDHYRSFDDADGVLRARINLAETALALGRPDMAVSHLDAAGPFAADPGRDAFRRRVALLRSEAALASGDHDAAERLLAPLLAGPADAVGLAAHGNRAALALARGEPGAAGRVEAVAERLRGRDAPAAQARLLRFQAELARRAGDLPRAEALLNGALAGYKGIPSRSGAAATLSALSDLFAGQGRWPEAADHARRALHVRFALLDRRGAAEDLQRLGRAEAAQGREARATSLRHWAEAALADEPVDWAGLRDAVPE